MTPSLTILAIDDDPGILTVLARGLPRIGDFRVVGVGSSAEALEVLNEGLQPHVVLLDHSVPLCEGLVDVLLASAQCVLCFTGQRLPQEEVDEMRVSGVVYKPFNLRDLAERLQACPNIAA